VIVPAMIGGARPHAGDLLVTEDIPLYRRGGKERDPQIAALAQDGKLFLVILEEPYYFQAGRRVYLSWREGLTPCYDVRLGGATLATVYRISPPDLDRLDGAIRGTIAAIEKDFRSQPQLKLAFGLQQLYGQLGLELPSDLKRVMIEQLKRGRDQALFFNERDTADRILKRLESSPDAKPDGEGPP
jgi:hypothetical protein